LWDPKAHKQQLLAHCLELAKLDPAYALTAAAWYETNEPQLLLNLAAKVRQELRRAEAADAKAKSALAPEHEHLLAQRAG
jgi:hypothetical protein